METKKLLWYTHYNKFHMEKVGKSEVITYTGFDKVFVNNT